MWEFVRICYNYNFFLLFFQKKIPDASIQISAEKILGYGTIKHEFHHKTLRLNVMVSMGFIEMMINEFLRIFDASIYKSLQPYLLYSHHMGGGKMK